MGVASGHTELRAPFLVTLLRLTAHRLPPVAHRLVLTAQAQSLKPAGAYRLESALTGNVTVNVEP